jgi:hypothetical protein
MAVAIVESTPPVTGGVDTHLDTHVVLRSTCRPATAPIRHRLDPIRTALTEWPITGLPAPPEAP